MLIQVKAVKETMVVLTPEGKPTGINFFITSHRAASTELSGHLPKELITFYWQMHEIGYHALLSCQMKKKARLTILCQTEILGLNIHWHLLVKNCNRMISFWYHAERDNAIT